MNPSDNKDNVRGKISFRLYLFYLAATTVALVIFGKIIYLQLTYDIPPQFRKYFKPKSVKVTLHPERGDILAEDGRLLAMSNPVYQVIMDCAVGKREFRQDKKHGSEKEKEWRDSAKVLARGLASIYKDNTASSYYKIIMDNRISGKRHVPIGYPVDYLTLKKIKSLPLFNKGANVGGIKVERIDRRSYPYGTLARRVIGYVKDTDKSNGNNMIGIEGRYDEILRGNEGFEWMKKIDNKSSFRIPNSDSSGVKKKNGSNIRTTINIDIQDIADKIIREQIEESSKVQGGCAIVMDVKTGAIRAMVNLLRDSVSRKMNESFNMAIGRKGEPGSVFKAVTLMSLLEDGKVNLDDEIETNHGIIAGFEQDSHIRDYEREHKTDRISIIKGFEMSSNYVFRKIAIDNYNDNPQQFIDKIFKYKLGEAFDFDLQGLETPTVPSPKSKSWSKTDLGSVAIGYTISESPLHIITFYNAIANGGTMMKPYIVASIEKDGGRIIKKFKPCDMGKICSARVADTLKRALMRVAEYGTGKHTVGKAACSVAGKTGTARIAQNKGYKDAKGRIQYQATFVGFFPAEKPKYSAIVVLYSYPGTGILYGGTLPAKIFKEIVDKLYIMDQSYANIIDKKTINSH